MVRRRKIIRKTLLSGSAARDLPARAGKRREYLLLALTYLLACLLTYLQNAPPAARDFRPVIRSRIRPLPERCAALRSAKRAYFITYLPVNDGSNWTCINCLLLLPPISLYSFEV
jgi:hypothetical protein